MQYVADLERNEDGSLQIMYGIGGETDLTETTLDHLKGYEGSRPVRKGNGAYNQRQNDVYGAVLDSVYLHTKKRDHIHDRLWPVLADQVRWRRRVWREPDQGIWEARGEPRHYVSSKLMCWVAIDRGARLAELRGEPRTRRAAGRRCADEIRADILDHGVDERGVFVQHYDTTRSTPRTCWSRSCASCPPTTSASARPCWRSPTSSTTAAWSCATASRRPTTASRRGGHVPDLLVLAGLSAVGDRRAPRSRAPVRSSARARLAARSLRRGARGRSGRHLGNYPQAFTHLALINAVTHVIAAQQGS